MSRARTLAPLVVGPVGMLLGVTGAVIAAIATFLPVVTLTSGYPIELTAFGAMLTGVVISTLHGCWRPTARKRDEAVTVVAHHR